MAEYETGQRLKVKLNPDVGSATNSEEVDLELEIVRPYKPFTMSVVCQVRVVTSSSSDFLNSLPDTLIIKLFDRRFQMNTREDYDKGRPWSLAKEAAYQRYLPEAPKTHLKYWRPNFSSEEEYRNEGEMEEYVEESCVWFFENESRAYNDMREIQGTFIPKLYGRISHDLIFLPSVDDHPSSTPINSCSKGFLLEYIPSTTLKAFLGKAMTQTPPPYDTISAVCNQAIKLMDRLDDFNVINKDARMDNVLVLTKPDQTSTHPGSPTSEWLLPDLRCVGIDFGNSRLRFVDETDEQWRRAKQSRDEMGAVGTDAADFLVEAYAQQEGGDIDQERLWKYNRNRRWHRLLSAEEAKAWEEDSLWGLHEKAKF